MEDRYLILIGSNGIWELHRNPQGAQGLWWTKKEAEREMRKIEIKNPRKYQFIPLKEATTAYEYGALKRKQHDYTLRIRIKDIKKD